MVIRILDIVAGADTSDQGTDVCIRIRAALQVGDSVVLSFDGINTATSSFVTAAFVPLLDRYNFNDLKRQLRVINSTRQINTMIKTRLEREGSVAA